MQYVYWVKELLYVKREQNLIRLGCYIYRMLMYVDALVLTLIIGTDLILIFQIHRRTPKHYSLQTKRKLFLFLVNLLLESTKNVNLCTPLVKASWWFQKCFLCITSTQKIARGCSILLSRKEQKFSIHWTSISATTR